MSDSPQGAAGAALFFRRTLIIAAYIVSFWILLPALLWLMGTGFDRWLQLPKPGMLPRAFGALLGAVSLWPLLYAIGLLLKRGHGLPISHLPPTRLVTTGLYERMRHPIYVCFTSMWVGLTLALGSWGAAFGSGAMLTLAWITYAVRFEEPRLRQRFGTAYVRYADRTGLVVPGSHLRRMPRAQGERAATRHPHGS